jgi:hypothetical protein
MTAMPDDDSGGFDTKEPAMRALVVDEFTDADQLAGQQRQA